MAASDWTWRPLLPRSIIAALALLMLGTAARADTYLDQIGRMDARIAVLRKQVELRNVETDLRGGAAQALPTVVSIGGFDDNLSAVLEFEDRRREVVRTGDRLQGGLVVRAVRSNGVVAALGKQEVVLARRQAPARAVQAAAPGAPRAAAGMPPPMPMPMPMPQMDPPRLATLPPGATAPSDAAPNAINQPVSQR